jgi:hypothetical protein
VAFSPQANYTDRGKCKSANLVPTFASGRVSHGQRNGFPTAVNLGFVGRLHVPSKWNNNSAISIIYVTDKWYQVWYMTKFEVADVVAEET